MAVIIDGRRDYFLSEFTQHLDLLSEAKIRHLAGESPETRDA